MRPKMIPPTRLGAVFQDQPFGQTVRVPVLRQRAGTSRGASPYPRQQFIPLFSCQRSSTPKGPERFALFYYGAIFYFRDDLRGGRPGEKRSRGRLRSTSFLTVLRLRHSSWSLFRAQHYGVNSIGRV